MVALNFADYHQYRFEEKSSPLAGPPTADENLGGYSKHGPAKMPDDYLERVALQLGNSKA